MTDLTYWIGFLAAVLLINISPGPEMIFVISTTVLRGRVRGFLAAVGAATGSSVHVLMVAFGLSVLLANSVFAFTVVKMVGATYLAYLGVRTIVSRPAARGADEGKPASPDSSASYLRGMMVGLLNPKSALFFLAFLPQFVRPDSGSYASQILILGMITVVAGILVEAIVISMVNAVGQQVVNNTKVMKWLDRVFGLVLVSVGIKLALTSQRD